MEWRPIHSLFDKYEASDDGKIRNANNQRVLHQYENLCGYMTLTCAVAPDNHVNVRVHRAVAEAFLGKCPEGYVVNHKDGNKKNNKVTNLEYITPSENNLHALRNGLRKPAKMSKYALRGEKHHASRITKEDVFRILDLRKETGLGCRRLAKLTGISHGTIDAILIGKSWKQEAKEWEEKQNA